MTATYHVDASDSRYRAITVGGGYPPTLDASALLGSWHREGYKYLSRDLARHLGALVAVVRDPADMPELVAAFPDS